MIILGLTGSLAMGKSTVAELFRARGIPVHNADEAVHRLYEKEAVEAVGGVFPQAIANGKVDRAKLRALLASKEDWEKLENAIHPFVHQDREKFLAQARAAGARLVVLDIPLLFETGLDKDCNAVAVVSAPYEMQKTRAIARLGMSEEKFESILSRQMPDAEKRARAHFMISTDGTVLATARQVDAIIRLYAGR
jgi:dephospho-CoA kinase